MNMYAITGHEDHYVHSATHMSIYISFYSQLSLYRLATETFCGLRFSSYTLWKMERQEVKN